MTESYLNYRRELVLACLAAIFAAGVLYDTRFIVPLDSLKALVALGVVGCCGVIILLTRYPRSVIQPAVLAAWPLHLYTIAFIGVSWVYHGGGQKSTLIAYTIIAYAAWLVIPVGLLMERRLFDGFMKMLAIGCALLALPCYAGAVGIDSLAGFPLSNKHAYSNFSGIIASGGIFEHAEGHALQMAIGLFCCLYAWRLTRHPLYGICTVMVLAGLIVSQGRGAIFGVAIAGSFYFLPKVFHRSRLLFLTGIAFCLLFPFLVWPQLAKIPGVSDYLRLERGLSGRDAAWLYAISLIEEEPWIGYGFGSSGDLSEDARKELRKSGYSGAGTTFHNTFITKAVEMGLPVTVLYTLMYLVPLIRICKPNGDPFQQQLVRSILVVALTASIFRDYNIGGIRSTSILVAVFLGLANLWPLATDFATAAEASRKERLRLETTAGTSVGRRPLGAPPRAGS